MIENIHLWHSDRGTYFDRNVNIISWSDQYHIHLGKYNSIGRDCNFFLHANQHIICILHTNLYIFWSSFRPFEIYILNQNVPVEQKLCHIFSILAMCFITDKSNEQ